MRIWWKIFSIIFLSCLILYFVNNFSNVFNLETKNLVGKINYILTRVSLFRASLAPVQEFVDSTFRGPTLENKENKIPETPEILGASTSGSDNLFSNDSDIIVGEILEIVIQKDTQSEISIQDQIDDISEKLDILAQEVDDLAAQEAVEKQKIEGEKKAEEAKIEEEKAKEEQEKTIIKKEEVLPKTTQTHQSMSGGISIAPSPADLQSLQKLLITEVQTEGDKSSYDFIEIYNPNLNTVYLKNYRLVKRAKTSSGDTTIKSWTRDGEISIPAQRYYLWASNEDGYDAIVHADVATSQTISDNNGIAIRFGDANTGEIVDALGWGDFNNVLFEGAFPLPPNLAKNKSLERKNDTGGNFIDTDNNQQDFIISNNPSPENSNNLIMYFDPIPVETFLDQDSLPVNPTFSKTAEFIFSANKENSIFECSLDNSPSELCVSPKKYLNLAVGSHSFQVFATDTNDNIDETPETFSWVINEEPVTESPPVENPLEDPLVGNNPTTVSHILITEAQIEGDKSSNDFIEIYNPTDSDLDISSYKLRKRVSTGTESSIRVFPDGSKILSKSYFVWANSEEDFHLSLGADAWSTATLAKDNSVAILTPDGSIIDALGWGEGQNSFAETASFITAGESKNPGANQSIERKKDSNGNYIDTEDNSQDFFLQEAPNPKN